MCADEGAESDSILAGICTSSCRRGRCRNCEGVWTLQSDILIVYCSLVSFTASRSECIE